MRYVPVMLLLAVLLSPSSGRAQQADLPIFDTHIHYNGDAWEAFSVEAALDILNRGGVYRALVSSTPDDGTLRLYEAAPDRVVPILRPYRNREDFETWTRDPSLLRYIEERASRGIHRGFGEFILYPGEAEALAPRRMAEIAAERDMVVLHAHADDVAAEELARTYPHVKVLWAHAGLSSRPATVSRLLDQYPNLWTELAIRSDIAPGGALDPAWRELFLRHPDRIMVGTDTWIVPRWARLPEILFEIRSWLRQLPPDVAERLGYGNAERLFPLYATP